MQSYLERESAVDSAAERAAELRAGPLGAPTDSLSADIVAIFTLTVVSIGFAVSFAALIFGGELDVGLSRATGSFVVAGGVMSLLVGWRSHVVPVATFVQEGPAIMMAAVAADFVAGPGGGVTDVFVLLVVTMLATSAAGSLFAHVGLGRLVRNVPTTMVGAFIGGMGWLLFKGGFDVMVNNTLEMSDLGGLLHFETVKFWLPGLIIGLLAWGVSSLRSLPIHTLGVLFATCLIGFYIIVALTSTVTGVESDGWLLGPFPAAGGAQLVSPHEFRSANWSGIATMAPGIAGVVGLTCVAQLLSLTGIKAEVAPQLDIDAEVRTSAQANLVVALLGATPGFQGLGYTVLLNRLGTARRAVSVVSGALVVVFGFVGVTAVGYVPRFIIGALLVMTGIDLLHAWIRRLMSQDNMVEQLICVGAVATVASLGLLHGIALGLAAEGIVFITGKVRATFVRSLP